MNIPRIVDAIGYIDDDLITAALEDPPRKRHNLMIKWMSVACLFGASHDCRYSCSTFFTDCYNS